LKVNLSIRNFVGAFFGLSVIYSLFFISEIVSTLRQLVNFFVANKSLLSSLLISSGLILAGHLIRSLRAYFLFQVATKTSVRTQFKAFSIGSLCNAILPFRFGELIRADVIAQQYKISFSFSLMLTFVERFVDCLLLFLLLLVFIHKFSIILSLITILFFAVILFLWISPKFLKTLIRNFALLFRDEIKAKIMFIFWTTQYGLKRLFNLKNVIIYLFSVILNWVVYLCALCPVISHLTHANFFDLLRLSVMSFYSSNTSVAPAALGTYSNSMANMGVTNQIENITLWSVIILPTAFIGLLSTIFKIKDISLIRKKNVSSSSSSSKNKLMRESDFSKDQLEFLEGYFFGDFLAEQIADKELNNTLVLSKYFIGGGSNAVTFLSEINDNNYVTKMVLNEHSQQLREQFEWLQNFSNPNIVQAYSQVDDGKVYTINIQYDNSAIDGYDYVHSHSDEENKNFYRFVLQTLFDHVYGEIIPVEKEQGLDSVKKYLEKHVYGCLDLAAQQHPSLAEIYEKDYLIINGRKYKNVYPLMNELKSPKMLDSLASFRVSELIHGDLILDNLIYSDDKKTPVLIDPVPLGNYFEGPVFDFGKIAQSLWCGYEFLLRDQSLVELQSGNEIKYDEFRSEKVEKLWRYVFDELASTYLTADEKKTMLFIGATNYFRRLKHQATQCPENTIKFYAVGVRYLNEYVRQFHEI